MTSTKSWHLVLERGTVTIVINGGKSEAEFWSAYSPDKKTIGTSTHLIHQFNFGTILPVDEIVSRILNSDEVSHYLHE